MRAAQNGHSECVEALLRAGARRDLLNADGRTAAQLATEHGHIKIAAAIELL